MNNFYIEQLQQLRQQSIQLEQQLPILSEPLSVLRIIKMTQQTVNQQQTQEAGSEDNTCRDQDSKTLNLKELEKGLRKRVRNLIIASLIS